MALYQRVDKTYSEPQAEPLRVSVSTENSETEIQDLLFHLQKVSESLLHHWKTFPLVLPPPITAPDDGDGTSRRKTVQNRELFVVPDFREMEPVSIDGTGQTQRLNAGQLGNIRNDAEFTVESTNFPGQAHKWKLSSLLQKGKVRTVESFLNDLAAATSLMVVTARNRLDGSTFSVTSSVGSVKRGVLGILDALFGIPAVTSPSMESKLAEERARYLVAELICPPNMEDDLDSICRYIREQVADPSPEKTKVLPVTYTFLTPSGLEIDLRHFCRSSIKQAMPVLAGILERQSHGWLFRFRESVVGELRKKGLEEPELEKKAQQIITDEYYRRVFQAIRTSDALSAICVDYGELLIEQAQCCIAMMQSLENCQTLLKDGTIEIRKELEFSHPILARIEPWLAKKLQKAERQLMMKMMYKCHEDALDFCRQKRLCQSAYFLARDLTFVKERAAVIGDELGRAKNPSRIFVWETLVWRPSKWVIRKVPQSDVPSANVIGQSSMTKGLWDPQVKYALVKHRSRSTSTHWPFWRWNNFFHRTWTTFWNVLFYLLIIIPWCSPVSLRALIGLEAFYPNLELSQTNGTLVRRRDVPVQTLCSRLLGLWKDVWKSRTEFESRPDTGFIGKSQSRHFNRVWNYGVKGVIGTILLLLVFPFICVLSFLISVTLAIFGVFWVPAFVLLYHVSHIFIYDFDSPDRDRPRFCVIGQALVFHLLIGGFVQPIVCLVLAAGVLPALALSLFVGSVLRYVLRTLWDGVLFHLLIKPKGRIPASEGFFVKLIEGPGLRNDYYYRISREQALAAFEARMEYEELCAYQKEMELLIRKPITDFVSFTSKLLTPFGLPAIPFPVKGEASSPQDGVAQLLDRETHSLLVSLDDKIQTRISDLKLNLNGQIKCRIRMVADDLRMVLVQASIMLEEFYPEHVFRRFSSLANEVWLRHGVEEGDWRALSTQLLSDIFSPDILVPLSEMESHYWLETRKVNLSRYTTMLENLESNPELPKLLDSIPIGAAVSVPAPCLNVSVFNPQSKNLLEQFGNATQDMERWTDLSSLRKTKSLRKGVVSFADGVVIPLPIPHPVLISVLIYNRDAEERDAVPLDSETVKTLLKSLEGNPAQSVPVTPGGETLDKSSSSQSRIRLLSQSSLGHSQSRQGSLDSVSSIPTAVSPESQGTLLSEGTPRRYIATTEAVREHSPIDRPPTPPSPNLEEFPSPTPAVSLLSSGTLKGSRNVIFSSGKESPPLFSDMRGTSTPINKEGYPLGLSRSSPTVPILQMAILQRKEQWLLGNQSSVSNISLGGSRESTPKQSYSPVGYASPNVRHKTPKAPMPLSDLPHLSRCLLTTDNPLDAAALGKSTSQESLMFVEEGLSLIESPHASQTLHPDPTTSALGSTNTLTSRSTDGELHLASFEDLSLVTSLTAENLKRYDTPV